MSLTFITARAHAKYPASIKQPDAYPRPWASPKGWQLFGRDAIPVSEFDDWYYGGE